MTIVLSVLSVQPWEKFEFICPWTGAKCVFVMVICLDLGQCRLCGIGSLSWGCELWKDWKWGRRVVSVSGACCNVDVWEKSSYIFVWFVLLQEGWPGLLNMRCFQDAGATVGSVADHFALTSMTMDKEKENDKEKDKEDRDGSQESRERADEQNDNQLV